MLCEIPIGHVVNDYYNGATHIVVCDDYITTDPEELKRMNDRVIDIYINDRLRKFRREHGLPPDTLVNYILVDPEDMPKEEKS